MNTGGAPTIAHLRDAAENALKAQAEAHPLVQAVLAQFPNARITDIRTPDQIAASLEKAEKKLGAGRVKYIHPDCGFWMLKRSIADAKIRALVDCAKYSDGRRLDESSIINNYKCMYHGEWRCVS